MTSQTLVEGPSLWRQQKTEIDGQGRPKKTTVYVQGTAAADQVTSYVYRNDGTLQSVAMPDPRVSTAALVTYTYTFDTLGRPLTIRRPDAIASGVDVTYNGVTTTTTEVVPGYLSIASTKSETDKLGRLWKVQEQTGTSTWAVTTYAYGPDDNVVSITDPQVGVTSLSHDYASRRTQIARGTRLWKYTYDKNGNVATEQVPSPNPALDAALYTSSFLYDDIDRVTEKQLAPRAMTAQDLDLFVAGRELFTYDIGFKGQLRYWQAFRPGASGGNADITFDLYHDGSGRRTITGQSAAIAGLPALGRTFMETYNPNGTLLYTRYRDVFPPETSETIVQYRYDARGLPSKIDLLSPQTLSIGAQTRNVAGLVINRETVLTGPMTSVKSTWTYDELGRVTDQNILRDLATTVARQQLTYFGNDDVKTLQHSLGATSRTFTYAFDKRHQITNVTTNPSNYFGATYLYGTTTGTGRITRATHTRTITPLPANADPKLVRDVNYVYSGVDPEQVTSLTKVSGGATYASYTYDLAGNQLTRTYPATNPALTELWEYVYDGKDQLRRATKKVGGVVSGSEEYWYGEDGQRFAVVKWNSSHVKTELTWFIGGTEAHYNGTGALTKIYSHLSLGTPIARQERTSDTATSLEFQFHGLASSTLATVAQSGTINASYSYAPFGEVLEATDAGGGGAGIGVHKRRSNDKIEDDLTGLAYYGARYFDKTLIGWTQADPLYLRLPDTAQLSSPRRANIYMFSLNNALRYLDPDGLDVKQAGPMGSSYRSEMEVSAARRANNMASDNWMQTGCSAYMPSGWCGGGPEARGRMSDRFSEPCNGVTSVCDKAQDDAKKAAACKQWSCGTLNTGAAIGLAAGIAFAGPGAIAWFAEALGARAAAVALAARLCFAAGTLVHTANGLRPIESIAVGDLVWAQHDGTGEVALRRVAHVSVTPDQPVLALKLSNRGGTETFVVTYEHPFRTTRGWIPAKDLRADDRVLLRDGGLFEILGSFSNTDRTTVYNFEVEEFHTYFVGTQGAWVHNNCERAREIISRLPGGLFRIGNCTQCADAMKQALTNEGVRGSVLTFAQHPGGKDFIVSDLLGGKVISTNGLHQAVQVGGMVFDNIVRGGIPYAQYVSSIHAHGGLVITSVPF